MQAVTTNTQKSPLFSLQTDKQSSILYIIQTKQSLFPSIKTKKVSKSVKAYKPKVLVWLQLIQEISLYLLMMIKNLAFYKMQLLKNHHSTSQRPQRSHLLSWTLKLSWQVEIVPIYAQWISVHRALWANSICKETVFLSKKYTRRPLQQIWVIASASTSSECKNNSSK